MNEFSSAEIAAKTIRDRYPTFNPKTAIVLGSGLGGFVECLTDVHSIDYADLLGFPKVSVFGHQGQVVLGKLCGREVICLQGRSHYYEGLGFDAVKTYVRTMKLLGCNYFIATNASGSLCADVGPGELMMIHDHINMQPSNPLVGPNDDQFGPRFPAVDTAYDQGLQDKLLSLAKDEAIQLHKGVYIAVPGPNYETAAEIRAFKILGADAVGMSTVPEVLVANHCGMKVAVIAIITNFATGLSSSSHSHEAVVAMAAQASEKLKRLLQRLIAELE